MEFVRECGSIQADLARRAGSLLRQYSLLAKDLPEAQKYDATLAVAVLGLLLVNCHEAMANLETDRRTHLLWPEVRTLVLDRAESNFPPSKGEEREAVALGHLRNAVSHPIPNRQQTVPVTGYSSRPAGADPTQRVTQLEFTSSPWVGEDGVFSAYDAAQLQSVRSSFGRFRQRYECDDLLEVRMISGSEYSIVNVDTGEPYLPVFSLTLELREVEDLALSLANFLAHGSLDSWDGEALTWLLTA